MNIRKCSSDDGDLLAACFTTVVAKMEDYPSHLLSFFIRQHRGKNARALIARKDRLCFIATAEGRGKRSPLGFISGFYHGPVHEGVFWIEWIGVIEGERRQGIAQSLLARLLAELKKRIHKVVCIIRPQNRISQRFFKKQGFKKTALFKRHWYKLDYYYFSKDI